MPDNGDLNEVDYFKLARAAKENSMPKFQMKSTAALVTFICLLIIGLTDFGFVVFGGVDNSLSAWFARSTYFPHFPPLFFFTFMMGAICSHLFWGMYPIQNS